MFDYNKEVQAKAHGLKQSFANVTTPEDGARIVGTLFNMTCGWEMRKEERMGGIEEFLQPKTPVQQAAIRQACMKWHIGMLA